MVTHNLRYAVEYGSRMLMMHQGQVILDKKRRGKTGPACEFPCFPFSTRSASNAGIKARIERRIPIVFDP